MGDGQGLGDGGNPSDPNSGHDLVFDIETCGLDGEVLSLDMLEKAAQQAAANFGKAPIMMHSHQAIQMMSAFTFHPNPEFNGLPWSSLARLTKRERRVAALHHFLWKIKALRNMTDEDHEAFQKKAVKRLKKAKWAKNAGKKVQSPA